jgi:hypothetical protein
MEREDIKKCRDSMNFFIAMEFPYVKDDELADVVRKELKSIDCDIDIKVIKEAIRKYSNNGGDDDIRFY